MSVDQSQIIDFVGVDESTGEAVLTISDHLDWKNSQAHQLILQEKLNSYLAFVENGELIEQYPDAKSRAVVLKIVFKFRPDTLGLRFLAGASEVVRSAGFSLRYELFAESYGN